MSLAFGKVRLLLGGLALLLTVSFVALASAQDDAPKLPFGFRHLIAAVTMHTADRFGTPNDVVVLARYDFNDDKTCQYTYFTYDARRNARATDSGVRHVRLLADARGFPGPFRLPTYSAFETIRGTWLLTGETLRIRIGDVIHDWVHKDAAEGFFAPAHPYVNALDNTHVIVGQTYSNTVGYAYLSNYANLSRRVTRDDLLPDYNGEIYMLLHQRGGPSRWIAKPSAFHQQRYTAFANGDILSYGTVSNRVNPPMWAFSTFLFNHASYSKLLAYSDGGHDFNRNGVYDELGHTMQYYGIFDGQRIAKFVFVEYSYQTSGSPLLTVGRYYGASPAGTSPPPLPRADGDLIPPLPTLRPR